MATGNNPTGDCGCEQDPAKKKKETRERLLVGRRQVLEMIRQAYGDQGVYEALEARRLYVSQFTVTGRFDGDVVLAQGPAGRIIHTTNGIAWDDGVNGLNYNVGMWSAGALLLLGWACAAGYEAAARACGSGNVNSAMAAWTLDSLTQNWDDAATSLRYLADCLASGLAGGNGTPEY